MSSEKFENGKISVRPVARPCARPSARPPVRPPARPPARPSARPPARPPVRPPARPSARPWTGALGPGAWALGPCNASRFSGEPETLNATHKRN